MITTTTADQPAALALFLLEKSGSIFAIWSGRMRAAEQRALFGRFMGKGRIFINGSDETVEHFAKVCFGTDSECTTRATWRELCAA